MIVDGLGVIGLPVSDREAKVLVSKCRKSPVGKGSETLLDDKVRKSWELNPSQFRISNQAAWDACMRDVITYVHSRLGVAGSRDSVRAELYKLLIYEEGAFFKPHKDTEKTKGMFGTLTVSLPSKHAGGDIVVSHNKEEVRFASAPGSDMVYGTSFSAWYSSVTHEVKPVLSGYRVVLIYNLIQSSGANKPKPYTIGSAKMQLKRCLTDWEHCCENGNQDLPYVIHKLDYDYSGSSLRLESLNGDDYTQVSCLQELCEELGFDMYFATHEKVLHKDDEAGDEVFDREESFKDLTTMDGASVSAQPEYCKDYYLSEPDDTDDEEPDDEEHEGWTGNEGAPAQYWYRSVVLLLVPPSCKIAFSLAGDSRYTTILKALPTLRKRAESQDTDALRDLKQYCLVALSKPQTFKRSYLHFAIQSIPSSDAHRLNCLEQVAEISLENGWMEIFARVPIDQIKVTNTLRAIGRLSAGSGNIRSHLPDVLARILGSNSISAKYSMWQSVSAAFKDNNPTNQQQENFDNWRVMVFDQIIKPTDHYARADCIALASLAVSAGEDMTEKLLLNLQRDDEVALAIFMADLSRSDQGSQFLKASPAFTAALEAIWDSFSFLFRARPGDRNGFSQSSKVNEGMTSQDILDLLRITDQELHDFMPMALDSMKDAVKEVTSQYLSNELITFVKTVLKHEVPALIPDENFEIAESVSELVLSILVAYVHQTVPDEPLKPEDWSLPYRGCRRCDDCKKVDQFMADPKQTKFEIRANKDRRRHLASEYEGYGYEEKDFTVKTIEDKPPYAWVCTKSHKRYNKLAANWRNKMKEAQHTLDSIGGKKRMALKAYLGEHYDAIASCRSEGLPSVGSSGVEQPLAEIGDSALNSRKRKADGIEDAVEGSSKAKRQRETLEQALQATEVVDLT